MADRSVSVAMTNCDLEWRNAKRKTFLDDIVNYAPTVGLRAIKFDRITRVGEGRVSMGSDTPHPKGPAPSAPNFFWDPYRPPLPFGRICFVVLVMGKGGKNS